MLHSQFGSPGASSSLLVALCLLALYLYQKWEELVCLRVNHGLTQQTLAEQVGVDWRTVQRWESGEVAPTTSHMMTLRQTLNEPNLAKPVPGPASARSVLVIPAYYKRTSRKKS